jgi:8-oxo-dGTP diphosphatase/2-hydroxy-dATP diphosphatase
MSPNKKKITDVTNMLFLDNDRLLLGYKKRGFGMGKYNGFGGKVKQGETLEEAAIREAYEESGLIVETCSKVGIVDFGESYLLRMHIYLCTSWSGQPIETEEMSPSWYPLDQLPYDAMWKDDKYWLPFLLKGQKIKAIFNFMNNDDTLGTDDNEIISWSIDVVDDLP